MHSIPHQRLHNQHLITPTHDHPAALLSAFAAMQGQDYAGAKWTLGLRLKGWNDERIEAALAAGEFVRTWALRGTLHLVAAADIHWLLALVRPRLINGNARRYQQLELDERTLGRSSELLGAAVEVAGEVDRPALLTMLEEAGISPAGQRGVYMLQHAALRGLICETVPRGRVSVYRPLPTPSGPQLEGEAALAELARRYVTTHGPATLQDFVWWSSLRTPEARAGLKAAQAAGQVTVAEIDGTEYWLPAEVELPETTAETAHLLPAFDEYMVAYRDRSAVLAAEYKAAWTRGGIFHPTLLVSGRVAGVWRRTMKKKAMQVEYTLFRELTAGEEKALQAAEEQFRAFTGRA